MRGILADMNVEGHVQILRLILEDEYWGELWRDLSLSVLSFVDLELDPSTPDDQVWRLCQNRELILITANRNDDGPTSLETTLKNEATPESLPVLTIANAPRMLRSRDYATQVANQLMEFLSAIDNYRGTGRLYLP